MVEWDFSGGEPYGIGLVPLIDPVSRTYEDVRVLAGLSTDTWYRHTWIAPDGNQAFIENPPQEESSLIDLRTFITSTVEAGFWFSGWAPDSQFALLLRDYDLSTRYARYVLLSVADGILYPVAETPVAAPAWDPSGEYLAYLANGGRTLGVLDVEVWATRSISLPRPGVGVFWRPQWDGLAVLADDGSLWRLVTFASGALEPLTPPLADVRDVQWSPDGTSIAFVAGTDVYVVSVGAQ